MRDESVALTGGSVLTRREPSEEQKLKECVARLERLIASHCG